MYIFQDKIFILKILPKYKYSFLQKWAIPFLSQELGRHFLLSQIVTEICLKSQ